MPKMKFDMEEIRTVMMKHAVENLGWLILKITILMQM